MEVNSTYIFQINDPLVKNAYTQLDNYEVVYNEGENVEYDLCVIYFSSNEIYYPNTSQAFKAAIFKKDKYEWKRNFISNAYKHIFIRDVQKQWYIEGINTTINSPDLIVELLKSLTVGFRTYTIGSSAGGFAAMLFGSLLKVDRVYAFNAQLNLNLIMSESSAVINPILFKHKQDLLVSKYYKVDDFIEPTVQYFYFQSSKSLFDITQFETFNKKDSIYHLKFLTSNHGFPFLRHNLKYVLSLSDKDLILLTKKEIHPFLFAVKIDGFVKTIKVVSLAFINRAKKKLKERRES